MQWILLVMGYVAFVATAAARKAHADAYASYPVERFHRSLAPDRYFLPLDRIRDLYEITGRLNLEQPNQEEPGKIVSKRALSVLSRWRPFGNLGVRMNTIHKAPSRSTMKVSLSPGMDFVSAETRGSTRPMGQPLRWGRKR